MWMSSIFLSPSTVRMRVPLRKQGLPPLLAASAPRDVSATPRMPAPTHRDDVAARSANCDRSLRRVHTHFSKRDVCELTFRRVCF